MGRVRKSIKTVLTGLFTGAVALASSGAIAVDVRVWENSINRETKERYLPVELWAGAEWDGAKALKLPKVEGAYRHRKATYQIKGPMEWDHPTMGQKFLVYERINPGRDGIKWQLFTINQDQNGLGRLYDGRPGRDGRLSSGGLKFPLGNWQEGETQKVCLSSMAVPGVGKDGIDYYSENRFCLSDQPPLSRILQDGY